MPNSTNSTYQSGSVSELRIGLRYPESSLPSLWLVGVIKSSLEYSLSVVSGRPELELGLDRVLVSPVFARCLDIQSSNLSRIVLFKVDIILPEESISAGLVLDVHQDMQRQPPELTSSFHHDARVVLTLHHGSAQPGLCVAWV